MTKRHYEVVLERTITEQVVVMVVVDDNEDPGEVALDVVNNGNGHCSRNGDDTTHYWKHWKKATPKPTIKANGAIALDARQRPSWDTCDMTLTQQWLEKERESKGLNKDGSKKETA